MKNVLIRVGLLCIFCWGITTKIYAERTPTFFRGELELLDFEKDSDKAVFLSGKWEFYWQKLIYPQEFDTLSQDPGYFEVPSVWNNGEVNGVKLTGIGFATYRLQIFGPFNGKKLSLEIPAVYNSYTLWVNEAKISENGTPGDSFENSVPQWLPLTQSFTADSDTLEVVMHVSNFRHQNGGISDPFLFGTEQALTERYESRLTGNVLLIAGLLVIAITILVYYLFARRHVSLLLFAGLCVDWSIRAFCTNLYLLIYYFENFNWSITMKLGHLTLHVALIIGTMFIAKSYPKETNKLFRNLGAVVSALFVVVTVVSSSLIASYLLTPFHIFAGVMMIFIINIVLKAIVNERSGAWFSGMGLILLVLVLFYDLLSFQGIFFEINYIFLSAGYLLVFMINGFALINQGTPPRTVNLEIAPHSSHEEQKINTSQMTSYWQSD